MVYNPNLLTAWSRVLLEKLKYFQLVKKFPAFYGTRRFITTFRSSYLQVKKPSYSSDSYAIGVQFGSTGAK
jgi:hypothetical protein